MKQIIIKVSKLDTIIGYTCKNLMLNYTEKVAIQVLEVIKSQFNDNFNLASSMYGERTYVRVCHLLNDHELKTITKGKGFVVKVQEVAV